MSRLYIKTENINGATVVADTYFTSPLKIAKPFVDNGCTELMIMQASAGILENDCYDFEFSMGENTSTVITNQSYTKLFKMDKGKATQTIKTEVKAHASFLYFPSPVIPFENSDFHSEHKVHLKSSSRFALCDILACGRIAMDEQNKFRCYHSRTSVYVDNQLVFTDNTLLKPLQTDLSEIGFFEGYTHQGMVYAYGFDERLNEMPMCDGMEIAITKAKMGRLIRIFGTSGDEIHSYIKKLFNYI